MDKLTEPRSIWRFALFVSCLLLVADICSKMLVDNHFRHTGRIVADIQVWKQFLGIDFAITYTANRGAAWGIFSGWQFWLVSFRLCSLIALVLYLAFIKISPAYIMPWMLIATGALGNILDTFIYGHVVDFLLFTFWGYEFAVFNVADCAISLGVTWLLLLQLKEEKAQCNPN